MTENPSAKALFVPMKWRGVIHHDSPNQDGEKHWELLEGMLLELKV